MQRIGRIRAIQHLFAFSLLLGMGGGCIAIYGFDDFERQPPIACKVPADCPGKDLCSTRECVQGVCKRTNPLPADIYPADQIDGDCKRIKCDGKGNEVPENDATDLPFDANECTDDVCSDGVPSNPPRPKKPCGTTSPPLRCSDTGFCTGCQSPDECGLPNNPCATFACENEICSRTPRNVGLIVDNAVIGDCTAITCTAGGDAREGFAASDAMQDDNLCTIETCEMDGTVVSTVAPDGTSCGDCLECINGTCVGCNSVTSVCYDKLCVPKPQTCATADECMTGYCVDGFCCDTECSGPCMACSETLTGKPSGTCVAVTNDTDPDNDCNNTAADTCWDGVCRCTNGVQDGTEQGTDCGGVCPPCNGQWDCGGTTACSGSVTPQCCENLGTLCANCPDQGPACTNLQGTTCVLGSTSQVITFGTTPMMTCAFQFACKYVVCVCK